MFSQPTDRRRAIGASLLAALATGCTFNVSSGPQLKGSGVSKTEERAVGGFTQIEVAGAIQLEVTVGPATSVVVTTDDNILPHVVTQSSGDRLRIAIDASYSTSLGVKVKATTPNLAMLRVSGASTCTLNDVAAEQFELELSGASACQLDGDVDTLDVTVSGASRATLVGTADELTIDCSGASRVEATDMPADRVTATVAGASTALVTAAEELIATASGASTVRYRGEPAKVRDDISGASTIKAE
jgi:hypothetical protein